MRRRSTGIHFIAGARRNAGMRLGLAALTVIAFSGGCASSGTPTGEAPDIPPEGTLVIDFSTFTENSPSLSDGRLIQAGPAANFGYSVLTIAFWNSIVTVTLAVPVAAFAESFNHTPTQLPDGTWQWSYDFTVDNENYSAKLQAETSIASSTINWTMLISQAGGYTDFEWFTGTSNLQNTGGAWSLNMDPNNSSPFVDVAWSRELDSDDAEIRYTYVVPDNNANGSYIQAEINTAETYDGQYVVYGAPTDTTVTIEWDRTTLIGRVMSEPFFEDAEWHCWNETFFNADCP